MSGHYERRLVAIAEAPRYGDAHCYKSIQGGLNAAGKAWSEAASDPGWGGDAVEVAAVSFISRAAEARRIEDALAEMGRIIGDLNETLDEAYNLLDALPTVEAEDRAFSRAISAAVAAGPQQIEASTQRITQAFQALEAAQAAREAAAQSGHQAVTASINHSQAQIVQVMASAGIRQVGNSAGKSDGEYDVFDDLDHASQMSYDKLVEWTSSKDFQSILWAARDNPGLLNDLLKNGMGATKWDPGSILALLFNSIGFNGGASLAAAVKIYQNFGTGKDWDMKVYLSDEYGRSDNDGPFRLRDESGRVVRSDVFGNVNYGMMMAHLGISRETALEAANLGTAHTGVGEDSLDDRAVEFGYEMYKKYPSGMTETQYREEIANAGLDG